VSHVDFYFDFSSPFAYLGATQIEAVAQRAGATLAWKPMLLGGVFRAIGTPMVPFNEAAASKQRYLSEDMERWARHWNVPFHFPTRFPMMTVRPLRMLFLLDDPVPFIHRVFAAYWAEDRDISDPTVLQEICAELGLDDSLVEATSDPAIKQALIDATTGAIETGVFGAPTCIVNDQLYWGQDRLQFVEKALSTEP
jgi:2-hydroxychromene-2-carboxylate isomerase